MQDLFKEHMLSFTLTFYYEKQIEMLLEIVLRCFSLPKLDE